MINDGEGKLRAIAKYYYMKAETNPDDITELKQSIAEQYNVSVATLNRWLREYKAQMDAGVSSVDLSPKKKGRCGRKKLHSTEADVAILRAYRNAGGKATVRAIASSTGYSRATTFRILQRLGCTVKKPVVSSAMRQAENALNDDSVLGGDGIIYDGALHVLPPPEQEACI